MRVALICFLGWRCRSGLGYLSVLGAGVFVCFFVWLEVLGVGCFLSFVGLFVCLTYKFDLLLMCKLPVTAHKSVCCCLGGCIVCTIIGAR